MLPIDVLITREFSQEWVDALRARVPAHVRITQFTAATVEEVPQNLWQTIHVLYSGSCYPDPADAPNLQWVQLDTAGVNHLLGTPLWHSKVKLTTLNGVAPSNMGEFAMMLILSFGHHFLRLNAGQRVKEWPTFQNRWDWYTPSELRGASVGVVGYGSIGQEVGRLAHAFGMHVIGVGRTQRTGQPSSPTYQVAGLADLPGTEPDEFFTSQNLLEALPKCDYVVLLVPHTSSTHHMFNEKTFRAMRPNAVLINLARGGVVDEQALIQALKQKWIAGAALDVFEEEPLPASSPLWEMPNVIITPHVAGFTSHYYERIMDLFSQNLNRWVNGQPLLNEVVRQREY